MGKKNNSIGIIAKAGRYGGTYAHKDIAFEFASWVSPKFKIYLIKEFQPNVSQLVCLANLENLNAVFISEGMEQSECLKRLNQIAIQQMRILVENRITKDLEG